MLTHEEAQFLTQAVVGLGQPLHTALEAARKTANEHYDEHVMTGQPYSKGRTDLTRDHARKNLEDPEVDLQGWRVPKRGSGRLTLYRDALSLKVLHGTPVEDIPAPGRNQARIRYYRNHTATLLGAEASSLLAIWTYDAKADQISIRVVRPVGTWSYRHRPVTDFDIPLPRKAEEFEHLVFIPNDQNMPLPFDLDEDTREEGESGGA